MKIYCGTDIIEVARIKETINNLKEQFISRIYTDNEIAYCESKSNMKYQHYAARFAAKEAVFKAISPMLKDKYGITWTDIEILNDETKRPFVKIIEEKIDGIEQIDISLSHLKEYAIANCIVTVKDD